MMRLRPILMLAACLVVLPRVALSQQRPEPEWIIESLTDAGWAEYDPETRTAIGTNGVLIRYQGAVLTADRVAVDEASGEVSADGAVRIQQGEQIWASDHLTYNFNTRQMRASQFRTGQTPVFASGEGLQADITNRTYYATNALLTTDDISQPGVKVRAKYLRIIPGKKLEARHAVLYLGKVPVFYFPYYTRNLGPRANNFNATPGYRSLYGAFVLGGYTWFLNDELDGVLHLDYREKRGVGVGPDMNFHLGRWGEGTASYYYTRDRDPNASELDVPVGENRQRVYFSYLASPVTNLEVRAMARYETDAAVERDFFERVYREDPQPSSYFEADKFWQNFSLDAYVQPRLNNFLETVERLPDLRLTGYRQQLGATPLYYESESSAGYYRRLFAEDAGTNGPPPGLNYEAARADTYHQVLLPQTFFGWLNVTPRVGGRFTYYSDASGPGATTSEEYRGVFNTGAEISFKASRLWPDAHSDLFDVDGIRHIIEPSANYVYVPDPTTAPPQLPQFDYELPSLRLLPNEFPDYNAIDSIDSQNVIRWGLRNRLQTKRNGQVVNLLNWDLYTDWRLQTHTNQSTFSNLYSDLTLRPRSWLILESLTRLDVEHGDWQMAFNTLTIQPSSHWSWRFGHYYLRDDYQPVPTALGAGESILSSTFLYRLNENWGFRMSHYFDVRLGRLDEQSYTVYRDLRSWTAALTFLFRNNPGSPEDFTFAFTFSLKAYPRYPLGYDTGGPSTLLGG